MSDSEPLPVNCKVELRPEFDKLYPLAFVGSHGWVRDRDESEVPTRVYIEWDKDHWRYNGESDGWTYENHFRMIEAPAPRPDPLQAALAEICPDCGQVHDTDDSVRIERYVNALSEATDYASDAEAFFMVIAKREQGQLVPYMVAAGQSEEAVALVDAQTSHVATLSLRAMAEEKIVEIVRGKDESRR